MVQKKKTVSDRRGEKMSARDVSIIPGAGIYSYTDMKVFQGFKGSQISAMESLDELLQRDKQRVKDGYPQKIKIGKITRPENKGIVVVPTTEEDKFIHGSPQAKSESGGQGDAEEGEVLSEHDIEEEGEEGEDGAGQGSGGEHELEQSFYELGRVLSEKFDLPNLRETTKKSSLYEVHYDLTDINRGSGQILNKGKTMREIIKTNIALGILDPLNISPEDLLVAPHDRVYNILSEEREYKSTAIVFFVRDYSGSMISSPTQAVLSIHLLIYSWLMYQYMEQVKTRFILHDTTAKEVADFDIYYRSNASGGTNVASAYKLVNQIVEDEGLASDNNIYVFHGTDGDDWDKEGVFALTELRRMMEYANRIGISIAENGWNVGRTDMEKYLNNSSLLDHQNLIRLDSFQALNVSDERIIRSLKWMIS